MAHHFLYDIRHVVRYLDVVVEGGYPLDVGVSKPMADADIEGIRQTEINWVSDKSGTMGASDATILNLFQSG